MAKLQYFVIILCLKLINANLNIDITAGTNPEEVAIQYSGIDVKVITEHEVKLFKIDDQNLMEAVKKRYGTKPSNVYLKSPTPWGDLYKKNHWEQVTRVLQVKSARVKSVSKRPVIVSSQDFENLSNRTIKVNAGISQAVENSVVSSWSKSSEATVSEEIELGVKVASGRMGMSYTSIVGKSEEKSETIIIGTSSGMETELAPGQAVSSVLSANRGYLEIVVVYKATLKGNVAVNFKKKVKGHHFWGPTIQDVMENGNLNNEVTYVQTLKVGFYSEASLKVYDKATGKPM